MIRIIGGRHRSRLLQTPGDVSVQPTKNIVREALFSILGYYMNKAVVLDLFAGSGALGLEALSRGAKKAYFCDVKKEAIEAITENVKSLKEEANSEIHQCDYNEMISYLEKNKIEIDVAFIDPPYEVKFYDEIIDRLLASNLLKAGGRLAIESDAEIQGSFLKNRESRRYRYGKTHLLILIK